MKPKIAPRAEASRLDPRAAKGRRVRVQVHSARTGYSTTVDLPFRFVGPVGTKVVQTPKGPREIGVCLRPPTLKDFVAENGAMFAVRRRQAIVAAARRNPEWVGRAAAKAPPKRKKGSTAARKPKAAPARKPKARRAAQVAADPPVGTLLGVAASPSLTERKL